jgi:hypothetical protein
MRRDEEARIIWVAGPPEAGSLEGDGKFSKVVEFGCQGELIEKVLEHSLD